MALYVRSAMDLQVKSSTSAGPALTSATSRPMETMMTLGADKYANGDWYGGYYQYPQMKTPKRRNLRNGRTCNLHKIGIGMSSIMRSMMTLEMALPIHHS